MAQEDGSGGAGHSGSLPSLNRLQLEPHASASMGLVGTSTAACMMTNWGDQRCVSQAPGLAVLDGRPASMPVLSSSSHHVRQQLPQHGLHLQLPSQPLSAQAQLQPAQVQQGMLRWSQPLPLAAQGSLSGYALHNSLSLGVGGLSQPSLLQPHTQVRNEAPRQALHRCHLQSRDTYQESPACSKTSCIMLSITSTKQAQRLPTKPHHCLHRLL